MREKVVIRGRYQAGWNTGKVKRKVLILKKRREENER